MENSTPPAEHAVDEDLRKAWDAALLVAVATPCSLTERAEALDYELTRIEGSLRAGYIAGGRVGFPQDAMRRVAALRQTFDLVCFLERNARDEKLADRIRQLKKAEEYAAS